MICSGGALAVKGIVPDGQRLQHRGPCQGMRRPGAARSRSTLEIETRHQRDQAEKLAAAEAGSRRERARASPGWPVRPEAGRSPARTRLPAAGCPPAARWLSIKSSAPGRTGPWPAAGPARCPPSPRASAATASQTIGANTKKSESVRPESGSTPFIASVRGSIQPRRRAHADGENATVQVLPEQAASALPGGRSSGRRKPAAPRAGRRGRIGPRRRSRARRQSSGSRSAGAKSARTPSRQQGQSQAHQVAEIAQDQKEPDRSDPAVPQVVAVRTTRPPA